MTHLHITPCYTIRPYEQEAAMIIAAGGTNPYLSFSTVAAYMLNVDLNQV